jgi:hypothetical protein
MAHVVSDVSISLDGYVTGAPLEVSVLVMLLALRVGQTRAVSRR